MPDYRDDKPDTYPVHPGEPLTLPALPAGGEVEPDVLEGEIVSETDETPAVPLRAIHIVRVVVQHEAAKTAGRELGYIPAGALAVFRHLRDSRTTAPHQRMFARAEAEGDHENAARWMELAEKHREGRHKRRMDRHESFRKTVLILPWILAALLVTPIVLGIMLAIATKHVREVAVPIEVIAHIIWWAVIIVSVAWGPLLLAAPWMLVIWLWRAGRRAKGATGWTAAAKAAEEERGLIVTADSIVLALQNTPVPELKKAFKDGWRPAFHTLPVKDGKGYFSVFSVPLGVTPAMIADKVDVFARNLHRAKGEVWPTDAERDKIAPAGYVALWVANPGVLDQPAPEWPLLHEGTADVFRGVPAGVSPRGDALSIKIVANNMVCGGIMGVGKSNACRVVMLGAALDPLAELYVHVFAYNGDFDAFAPRLARYVKGTGEEQIAAAMDTLNELYAEVERREQRISDLGAKKVTRELAQRYPDLRPRLALFSECHELFGHKEFGDEATELATQTMRRARKTAIWMGFDTQDARKDAIPPKIVSLVSVNVCFAVKSWRANDGFLGDGSFQAGIRATELRANRDMGRAVTTGVSDAQFELLKWHYIFSDDDTGQDDAAPVIARAMAGVAAGTATGGARPLAIVQRDLLTDLGSAVKGDGRVKLRDAIGLLRGHAPAELRYKKLTAAQLREELEDEGVKTVNTSGTIWLETRSLREVLATRDGGE